MPYIAVQPDELSGFPRALGLTSDGHVAADLEVNVGADGYWLTFSCADRDGVNHPSVGIAAGLHRLGDATWNEGYWSGEYVDPVRTGPTNVTWHSSLEGATGTLPFYLSIDANTAAAIQAREQEHLDDFSAAWDCSLGCLRWALGQLTAAASQDEALTALAHVLSGQGLDYLVPADPHEVDAWGQRARTVHAELCGHSKKRDRAGEHSPVRYTVWLGDASGSPAVLYAPTEFRPLSPDSYAYVVPAELQVVYGGAVAPAAQPGAVGAALAAGQVVAWATDPPALESSEMDGHPQPDLSSTTLAGSQAIQEAVRNGKFKVHSVPSEVHVWLEAALDDLGGDFTAMRSFDDAWGDAGYVRIRSALLRPA
jgi:hypothetical protein